MTLVVRDGRVIDGDAIELKNLSKQHLTAKRDLLRAEIGRTVSYLQQLLNEHNEILDILDKKGKNNDKSS